MNNNFRLKEGYIEPVSGIQFETISTIGDKSIYEDIEAIQREKIQKQKAIIEELDESNLQIENMETKHSSHITPSLISSFLQSVPRFSGEGPNKEDDLKDFLTAAEMFIEIDPSMSSKLIPYLLRRLKGHAETITEDRDFRTFDELKNCL